VSGSGQFAPELQQEPFNLIRSPAQKRATERLRRRQVRRDHLSALGAKLSGPAKALGLKGAAVLLMATIGGGVFVGSQALGYQHNDLQGQKNCSVNAVEYHYGMSRKMPGNWEASITCGDKAPMMVTISDAAFIGHFNSGSVVAAMQEADKNNHTINIDKSIGVEVPILSLHNNVIDITVNK
jgi:hypothetical protein